MGTKLRYAMNTVASASKNSTLANYQVGDCGYSQKVVQKDQIDPSSSPHIKCSVMEGKVFDMHNIESIRKTMLMQNDIFQQQVIELHRLYEHQKKLMCELKKEVTIVSKQINTSEINTWHQTMPMQEMEKHGFGYRDEAAPSTSTRNGGIESNQTRQASYGLENHVNKCNMLNNDDNDEEVDVELSLSIGCSSKKRLKSNGPHRMASCSMDIGSSETYSNGGGGGLSSCAINERDLREQSLGDSGLVLSNSSEKLNQNVPKSIWFFTRS